ncbi:MAG TPA: N-acetylmuramoyl-L-alanine amidase, partial [Rubrobacter sp.]|nr:N-acetylmuramoyl-L-alanine amidase [Rubrobacter sp.]
MVHAGFFRMWATGLAAILATVLLFATFTTGARAQEPPCTVVLDPGHGGTDSRAVNSRYGITEKDQNLDVATRLKTLLENDRYSVCMTRTTDKSLSNNERYTYANTTGASVLVSIHMNGSTNTSTDYTTTLFGKWRKDKELATTVFDSLSTLPAASGTGTIATRTPYSFASGVLLKSDMPAIIAETVFVTNDREGQLLSDGTGTRQQQIAQVLMVGIEDYLTTL